MNPETPRTNAFDLGNLPFERTRCEWKDHARQLERELNEYEKLTTAYVQENNALRKTAGIVADWLERSHQINPADMVARNMDLAKELRMAAMPNEKRSATGDQDVPPAKRTDSDTAGWLHRLVRPTGHSQNENESACSSPDTSGLPESAYKNGRVTFSGVMMTPEGCQKSFENWFGERTPQFRAWGKGVLARWKESGYPSLGDWPPQEVEVDLLVYSLGVMCGASRPNDKLSV